MLPQMGSPKWQGRYKINTQKLVAFLYTSEEQPTKEIMKQIHSQ